MHEFVDFTKVDDYSCFWHSFAYIEFLWDDKCGRCPFGSIHFPKNSSLDVLLDVIFDRLFVTRLALPRLVALKVDPSICSATRTLAEISLTLEA